MLKNIYAGDTINLDVIIRYADGTPVNITGSTLYFTMKSNLDLIDANAEVQVITTMHVDAANGLSSIHIAPVLTNNLRPGTYYYDIQFKDAAGNIKTILYGTTKILQTVTKTI